MAKKKYYGKGGMISSNSTSFANLPQDSMMKEYPKISYDMTDMLDDTITGVDAQIDGDARGGNKKKGKFPRKW